MKHLLVKLVGRLQFNLSPFHPSLGQFLPAVLNFATLRASHFALESSRIHLSSKQQHHVSLGYRDRTPSVPGDHRSLQPKDRFQGRCRASWCSLRTRNHGPSLQVNWSPFRTLSRQLVLRIIVLSLLVHYNLRTRIPLVPDLLFFQLGHILLLFYVTSRVSSTCLKASDGMMPTSEGCCS